VKKSCFFEHRIYILVFSPPHLNEHLLIVEEPPLEEGFRETPNCGAGEPMSEPCQSALCSPAGLSTSLSVPLSSRTLVSRRDEEIYTRLSWA
jgi:hypothetical protein